MARGFFVRTEKDLPFADWIADGVKRTETRNRRTLDAVTVDRYLNGWGYPNPAYIIRTESGKRPVVIGKCFLSMPYWCPAERFQTIGVWAAHRVPAGSKYDAKPGKGKWIYDIWDAERITPFELPEDAVRHGRVWAEFGIKEA